jgi:kynurenine formamidase
LPHADAPAHILPNGKTIEKYFENLDGSSPFWGPCVVLHMGADQYVQVPDSSGAPAHALLRVTLKHLQEALFRVTGARECPERLLLTSPDVPEGLGMSHHPDWVLVLDWDAAEWLAKSGKLVLYGTSWKSTDFMPGSRERPIHTLLFESALIYECLKLRHVPEGSYLWVGPPLPLEGASESPACPVLFSREELRGFF